jgi:hypothetical protein
LWTPPFARRTPGRSDTVSKYHISVQVLDTETSGSPASSAEPGALRITGPAGFRENLWRDGGALG